MGTGRTPSTNTARAAAKARGASAARPRANLVRARTARAARGAPARARGACRATRVPELGREHTHRGGVQVSQDGRSRLGSATKPTSTVLCATCGYYLVFAGTTSLAGTRKIHCTAVPLHWTHQRRVAHAHEPYPRSMHHARSIASRRNEALSSGARVFKTENDGKAAPPDGNPPCLLELPSS